MYKCTGCCTISTKMCDVSNLVYLWVSVCGPGIWIRWIPIRNTVTDSLSAEGRLRMAQDCSLTLKSDGFKPFKLFPEIWNENIGGTTIRCNFSSHSKNNFTEIIFRINILTVQKLWFVCNALNFENSKYCNFFVQKRKWILSWTLSNYNTGEQKQMAKFVFQLILIPEGSLTTKWITSFLD